MELVIGSASATNFELLVPTFAAFFANPLSIVFAVFGLGVVIFVHELGHFAVAKWCNVKVERFSIGFGPVLWSVVRGGTEYALSLVPFGGYVKMLGQDDVDPTQMTSQDIAKDPESYTSKTVFQRMGIISAGVIMNIITGTLFFAAAYGIGHVQIQSVIGETSPGLPAWIEGIQVGDKIEKMNKAETTSFAEISQEVMLSQGTIKITGTRANGDPFEIEMDPQLVEGGRRALGISPAWDLKFSAKPSYGKDPVFPGSIAAEAELKPGDLILSINEIPVSSIWEFQNELSRLRNQKVVLELERANETTKVTIDPEPLRTVGIRTDIGQVAAIQKGSPADGKIRIGDKITHLIVEGKEQSIGEDIDAMHLPQILASHAGKTIGIRVQRAADEGDSSSEEVELIPRDFPTALEEIYNPDSAVGADSIGVAFHLLNTVIHVEENSQAASEGIAPGDIITKAELTLPEGAKDEAELKPVEFLENQRNWPQVFALLQRFHLRHLKLTLKSGNETKTVVLEPQIEPNAYSDYRGFDLDTLTNLKTASNPIQALSMGGKQTMEFIHRIYQVLYALTTGNVPLREVRGPLGIAGTAAKVAEAGLAPMLFFLGYLSINLAVLNFLPIPLLDGGHMVFLFYELIRGKPASNTVLIIGQVIGICFVVFLMIIALGMDLLRLFNFMN